MKKKSYVIPKIRMVSIPVEAHLCAGTTEIVGVNGDNEATTDALSNRSMFFENEWLGGDDK